MSEASCAVLDSFGTTLDKRGFVGIGKGNIHNTKSLIVLNTHTRDSVDQQSKYTKIVYMYTAHCQAEYFIHR